MATFTKFYVHSYNLVRGFHDFENDDFKVALTNDLPALTDEVLSSINQISAGFGYTAGGMATAPSVSAALGVTTIFFGDVLFTASGGQIGPVRYAVIYNDTQTSPNKPLIGFWDRGSSVTLEDGDGLLVDFNPVNGTFLVI